MSTTDPDRASTIEGEVLDIVANHGGEHIVAGPQMEALVRELAALVERYADEGRGRLDADQWPSIFHDPPRGSLPEGT